MPQTLQGFLVLAGTIILVLGLLLRKRLHFKEAKFGALDAKTLRTLQIIGVVFLLTGLILYASVPQLSFIPAPLPGK